MKKLSKLAANEDSYTSSMVHNYHLYGKDGKMSMVPWVRIYFLERWRIRLRMRTLQKIINLEPAREEDLENLKRKIQEAFGAVVAEKFGQQEEKIPEDEDLDEAFHAPDAVVYHLIQGNHKVGGAVLSIHRETQHNSLDFFFISPEYQNKGLGCAAWKAIEARYPDTKVWHTVTPYFEKRNIHFYVNCCGFKIIEFWNKCHPDPHEFVKPAQNEMPVEYDETFLFEKVMG